jgi:peroxiredoxin
MNIQKTAILFALILSTNLLFAKHASLSGKILNNTKYEEIHLQDIQFNTIETQKPDENGYFKFDTKFTEFDFYLIAFDNENFVIFFPEPGEQTQITIDLNDLRNPVITNSKHSELYYEYSNKLGTLYTDNDKQNLVKKMIDNHSDSPTCIFFIDLLDVDSNYAYHEKLSKGVEKYSHNLYVSDFIKKTNNIKKLSIGGTAPEIALKNPDGKTIKLSSLRGQYVLIDFWASWCGPCRYENPNVVKMYNKYHDKGFEIYGVSLDRDKASWLKAIEDDGLTWVHVSDLQFWNSAGAKTYNVTGIPYTVLLDKEGKIIAKGLRGASLEQKLEEIFGSVSNESNNVGLDVGDVAPELEFNSPEGNPVKLSSLRGKYVLIDFWASWCGPCRRENPNNVKLYNKYRNKGFEIYGVSLDQNKDSWKEAIKKDGLEWVHVSDLKYWNSEAAKIYKVEAIPHTVLLDKNGRIIAVNLRGETLTKKLNEIFGE